MLQNYDIKTLLALQKSLEGRKDFFKWLINSGYPELAAFSNAVRGDEDALQWLLKSKKFAVLGVLSNAIDGEANAVAWMREYNDPFLLNFIGACGKNPQNVEWFIERDLKIFLVMTQEINKILDVQVRENTFWYKMKF